MKEILENWIKEQGEDYGTGIFYSLEMIQKFAEYYHNLQLHKTQVMCSLCGDLGYTIEVEAECCGDYKEYGCCGVPNPIQVQKQCYCNGGELPI